MPKKDSDARPNSLDQSLKRKLDQSLLLYTSKAYFSRSASVAHNPWRALLATLHSCRGGCRAPDSRRSAAPQPQDMRSGGARSTGSRHEAKGMKPIVNSWDDPNIPSRLTGLTGILVYSVHVPWSTRVPRCHDPQAVPSCVVEIFQLSKLYLLENDGETAPLETRTKIVQSSMKLESHWFLS